MPRPFPNPAAIVFAGVLLGLVVPALGLSRPRVRAYVRAATWLGVVGWWLLVTLVWAPFVFGPGLELGEPSWLWWPLLVLAIVVHGLLVGTPLFAIGATLIWLIGRRRGSGSDLGARGA